MKPRVTAAASKALDALAAAVADPGTGQNRAAADAIVALRRQFTHEGRPDWAGRSPEYRDAIERIYRQAQVPSDSEGPMQANLRYHVGNAIRRVAAPEDLEALGLVPAGPLARVRASRETSPRPTRAKVRTPGDPVALANFVLAGVRALRTMEPGADVEPVVRKIIDEALDLLAQH